MNRSLTNGSHPPPDQISSFDSNLLNIWEFVHIAWGLSPPKRRVVRRRKLAHRRVPSMCRTWAGFMSTGVVDTKIMTFFQKCVQVGLDLCCGDLRSVGGTVGSRPIPASWPAGCSIALGRYSDLAGVSQSDWPLCV